MVNGQPSTVIAITDRGFQYGDGLFETLAVNNRKPVFLSQHLQRLITGCQRLGIPAPQTETLIDEARHLCRQTSAPAVLKIIVTRGSGGRGYQQPDPIKPTRVLSLHPFPEYPAHYWTCGIVSRFCQTRLGSNPALAGIKHLNRLEQIIARAEWRDNDIQEGLMLGNDGFVLEGTMSNVFYLKNQQLYTPNLSRAGIAGIIRGLVLSCGHGINATVTQVTVDNLLDADELFVCNSVIGIWPVRLLGNRSIPVGPLTRQIQTWLHELQHENVCTKN